MPLSSMPLHNSDQRQNMSKTWISHTWLDKLQCYMICYRYTTALPATKPLSKKNHSRKLSRRCNRFYTHGLQNQKDAYQGSPNRRTTSDSAMLPSNRSILRRRQRSTRTKPLLHQLATLFVPQSWLHFNNQY